MPSPEMAARELLQKAKVSSPPVPLEKIAKILRVRVKFSSLEGDISGLLYKKNNRAVIGVNALHPMVRQRFTLAHELGHFYLEHKGDFFLDRRVLFRDTKSKLGIDPTEISANKFAAELLMPEDMLRKELRNNPHELDDEEAIESLAIQFEVSAQAMAIRLKTLGFIVE